MECRSLIFVIPKTIPNISNKGEKLKGNKPKYKIQSGRVEYPKTPIPKPTPKSSDHIDVTKIIGRGEATAIMATIKLSGYFFGALLQVVINLNCNNKLNTF